MPTINWSKINEKRGEAEAEKWKGRELKMHFQGFIWEMGPVEGFTQSC